MASVVGGYRGAEGGGGEGLEAELDVISSTLQDRVFGLVEGYQRLHELAAYGPSLVQRAATSIAEAALSADTAGGGSASPSWLRRKTTTSSAAEREQLLSNVFLLHEERLAVERAISQGGPLAGVSGEQVGSPVRFSRRRQQATGGAARGGDAGRAGRAVGDGWLRTDRPLPIPVYPASRSTPPTTAASALDNTNREAGAQRTTQEGRALPRPPGVTELPPPNKRAQLEHGYVLPPEVQAALVFLPKANPSILRRPGPGASSSRPPRTRSPARQSGGGAAGLSHLLEDLPVVLRQQRLLTGLRSKLTEVERKGQASSSDLAGVHRLMREQEKRQKELELALKQLTHELARHKQPPPPPTPPPPPPLHEELPATLPSPHLDVLQEEEDEGTSYYRVLQPRTAAKTTTPPPPPETAEPVGVTASSAVRCISVEGAHVELLVSQHGRRTEHLDGAVVTGGEEEEEEEEEEDVEARSLSEGRQVVVQGEGQGGDDWWERMETCGLMRDVHRGHVVDVKRAIDATALYERLQGVLIEQLGPLVAPPVDGQEVEAPPPVPVEETAPPPIEPVPTGGREVAVPVQPAAVAQERPGLLDEEELALRVATERTKWELEKEKEALAEKDKHLQAAMEREARDRVQLEGCLALLTDLTHRVTTMEASKPEPPPPPMPAPPPPPPLVIQVPPPPVPTQEARPVVSRAMQTVQRVQLVGGGPPPLRLPSGRAEEPEVMVQSATMPPGSLGSWDESDVSQLSFDEELPHASARRGPLPPLPSPPGSSASEGQVYLDDAASQASEGQLTRSYRQHRRRDGRAGAAPQRTENWRSVGPDVAHEEGGARWASDGLKDSLDEMLSDVSQRDGRKEAAPDTDDSPLPVRMPVRLLRWKNT